MTNQPHDKPDPFGIKAAEAKLARIRTALADLDAHAVRCREEGGLATPFHYAAMAEARTEYRLAERELAKAHELETRHRESMPTRRHRRREKVVVIEAPVVPDALPEAESTNGHSGES